MCSCKAGHVKRIRENALGSAQSGESLDGFPEKATAFLLIKVEAPPTTHRRRRKSLSEIHTTRPFSGMAGLAHRWMIGDPQDASCAGKATAVAAIRSQASAAYVASSTGSSHSLDAFTPGTSMARWLIQLSGAAPCQCLTSAGMLTTSPGVSSRAGWPSC